MMFWALTYADEITWSYWNWIWILQKVIIHIRTDLVFCEINSDNIKAIDIYMP